MKYYKKLIGEKCYLTSVASDDAESWTCWFNDLEVTVPLGNEAYIPTSLDKEREGIEHALKSGAHMFSIVDLQSDIAIGRCLLFDVNLIDRNAKLGIFIGNKEFWGKGFGSDALRLLLDYGFNLLNLNNIMLGAFAFNERAIQCYKKVGFKEIGRRRQARIIGGVKYDSVLMDMLAEEFESIFVKPIITSSSAGH
ncbi:GNAT family N-acetyltransferase [Paenibacillus tritici]|uniref:GNAT family N-acetyltransferase n=1 Tax=Paenibacillus tritici TaxID=1873425 RepID=UPI001BA51B7A|nr:GNAT family protein [Paenibacillus tritici]QUL52240.1 GNAT family N-acetyltransferase [Paenibacillus tritici]